MSPLPLTSHLKCHSRCWGCCPTVWPGSESERRKKKQVSNVCNKSTNSEKNNCTKKTKGLKIESSDNYSWWLLFYTLIIRLLFKKYFSLISSYERQWGVKSSVEFWWNYFLRLTSDQVKIKSSTVTSVQFSSVEAQTLERRPLRPPAADKEKTGRDSPLWSLRGWWFPSAVWEWPACGRGHPPWRHGARGWPVETPLSESLCLQEEPPYNTVTPIKKKQRTMHCLILSCGPEFWHRSINSLFILFLKI